MSVVHVGFADLLKGVLAGNRQALELFCQRYQSYILRVVRRRLPPVLRSKFDSMDFVNDVWASFIAEPPQQPLASPEVMIAYLEQMTRRKVGAVIRERTQLKNDVHRECPLPEPAEGSVNIPLPAADPTPSRICSIKEEWERLLLGRTPQLKRILYLLRNGVTYREIAERLRTNEKTVRRLVRRLELESDQ